MPPGTYRNITGNTALALGLVAAAHRAGLPLVLGSYPITPASDILHALAAPQAARRHDDAGRGRDRRHRHRPRRELRRRHRRHDDLGGPGVALKSESIGLAVSLELPLVIVDVQRGGPSTGLPTKTEQADLLQAMFGRNGESPVPIVAPQTPADCFPPPSTPCASPRHTAPRSSCSPTATSPTGPSRGASRTSTSLPDLHVAFASEPNGTDAKGEPIFHPFLRDPETLARPWAVPGTPGPRAPHRWHREGRRHRQHLLRPRQPRPDDPAAPGQGRRHRGPRPRGRRPERGGPRARARLGLDVRPDRRRHPGRAQRRPPRRPGPPRPTSTRSRATSASSCATTTASSCPR